jgi:hypothetical protein
VSALQCLAACALREDVSLLLHQDRRHHALLNYAHRIDVRPLPEQRATARVASIMLSVNGPDTFAFCRLTIHLWKSSLPYAAVSIRTYP